MTILWPRDQDVLPKWHLSVVLKGLMKPTLPLTTQTKDLFGDTFIQTAFLLRWLLVLEDQILSSYPEPSSTWNLPLWLWGLNRRPSVWSPSSSLNQRPEIIPEPIRFQGMVQLFPDEPARLLCPVRVLGLYLSGRLIVLKKILRRSFCALQPCYSDVFNAFSSLGFWDFSWRMKILPRINAQDLRGISALISYDRNTPLQELCGLIGWKSSNVFALVRHYVRDMTADTELQDIPLVAARTAFL